MADMTLIRSGLIELRPADRLSAAGAFNHPFLTGAHGDLAHRHLEFAAMAIRDSKIVKELPIQVIERYSNDPVRAGAEAVWDHMRAAAEGHLEQGNALFDLRDHEWARISTAREQNQHAVDQVCAALLSIRQCDTLVHLAISSLVATPPSASRIEKLAHFTKLLGRLEFEQVRLFDVAYLTCVRAYAAISLTA